MTEPREIFAYGPFMAPSDGDSRGLVDAKKIANRVSAESLKETLVGLAEKERKLCGDPKMPFRFDLVTGYHGSFPYPVMMGKISW